MDHVWIIETGDYEQRTVFGVAASLEAAVAYVKSRHRDPYVVDWMSLDGEGDHFTLRGHFENVTGYSVAHVGEYDIAAIPLIA